MEDEVGNKSSTNRSSLRSRPGPNHMTESVGDPNSSISTVWSGYSEWMAGCLARLYQSEDLCDVTLDVGLRTVGISTDHGCFTLQLVNLFVLCKG